MGSLYKYLKNKIKYIKTKEVSRALCAVFAAVFVIGGGFLGVNQFEPDQRVIDIVTGESEDVSLDILVMSADGEEAGEDEQGTEDNSSVDIAGSTSPTLTVNAKAALLMDAVSGEVLFAYNENDRLPPASVTKVMTMLLVLEAVDSGKISLSDTVTISERAASMGGSQMYMEPGEQHTLEELMKGIAMVSANDACVAVAEYVSGSMEIFVEDMNKRASSLGLENTNFVNTNGLPVANHYTSAHDIAVMSRELLKHTAGHEWYTTWQDTIKVGLPGKETEFGLTNTNKLIKQYQGAIGLKTGFTQDAGYCLSGAAQRDGTTLIAVVLGCQTSDIRLAEISKMLDYGFANYETALIAEAGQAVGEVYIEKGNPEKVNAVTEENASMLVAKGEKGKITSKAVLWDNVSVPLSKGDQIGELIIFEEETEIARKPLVAEASVEKATFTDIYVRILKRVFEN